MINQERLVQEFIEMVKIDSLSKQEGKFAAYLKEKLIKLGLEVFIDEQAGQRAGSDTGNLVGRLQGKRKGVPVILFSAHMDTVPLGVGIQPQIREGAIYSSGKTILGSDDKAGIAIILEALRHIQEEKIEHGGIEVLFTIGEEAGLLGSRYLDYSLLQAEMGFVLDSDGVPGTIICQAPAHERINAVIYGKAAHAGMNPEDGVNAIQVAARAINKMNLLRIDEETTANIGVIKGGEVTNIVCERVILEGEARSLSEERLCQQIRHMVNCLQEACDQMGACLEVKTRREYPVFKLEEAEPIIKIAREAAKFLGLEVNVTSSGGGSDTNYFSAHGLKTVNLGIGMSQAHTTEEFIKIKDLVMSAHYVAEIIQQVARSE
ncbi:MAG TPA: M20/M25/M40 family metallo-hydrolase [Clostridia bacterium]|jgi:tripeptide aminopeptidase|nr:M20/M25/M40 family metallo-hydrolase [Clostridia bacterium]